MFPLCLAYLMEPLFKCLYYQVGAQWPCKFKLTFENIWNSLYKKNIPYENSVNMHILYKHNDNWNQILTELITLFRCLFFTPGSAS